MKYFSLQTIHTYLEPCRSNFLVRSRGSFLAFLAESASLVSGVLCAALEAFDTVGAGALIGFGFATGGALAITLTMGWGVSFTGVTGRLSFGKLDSLIELSIDSNPEDLALALDGRWGRNLVMVRLLEQVFAHS